MLNSVYELLPGIAISCATILAAHLGLWSARLSRPVAYIIGTSCVLSGMFVSALLTGNSAAVWFYLAHLFPAGLVVVTGWWFRGERARRAALQADLEALEEAARNEQSWR